MVVIYIIRLATLIILLAKMTVPRTVCDLGPIRGRVLSTIINLNCPDGATYSQTVYEVFVARARGFCDCLKLTFYVANISFIIQTTNNPSYTGYLKK